MSLNQKGEGKAGAIFGFAVFLLVLYLAWTIIPVMIRVYSFEDTVREECKFLHGRNLDQLKEDIVEVAHENELDIEVEDVHASKTFAENYHNLRVKVDYVVPIVTPFYVYNWKQNIDYDAPVFE
jgi:hypothetical protein